MAIVIDTWAWVALFDKACEDHETTARYVREAFDQGGRLVTTNFILCETITWLFARLGPGIGERYLDELQAMRKSSQFVVEEINPKRFEKALLLRRRYRDKPNISFTDLTTMVVMRESGITDILTADQHFLRVNLGLSTAIHKYSNVFRGRKRTFDRITGCTGFGPQQSGYPVNHSLKDTRRMEFQDLTETSIRRASPNGSRSGGSS
jgi:predicted nucleic acid-binding protein